MELLCGLCLFKKQLPGEKISETNVEIQETTTDWKVRSAVNVSVWYIMPVHFLLIDKIALIFLDRIG